MTAKSLLCLRRLSDIIKKVAKEHDMEEEEVEQILDHFFRTLKMFMMDSRIPKIQITNFGTFRTSIALLRWHMRMAFWYREKGWWNTERVRNKIKKLYPIKNRLVEEKMGKYTYKKWQKIKIEN